LQEYLIGTGGWEYFHIPGIKSLVAYSRLFNFVEVNSTFYRIPPMKQVERWRKQVPQDFQFSVRASRTITHKHLLKPTTEALDTFNTMKKICETLKTNLLHLQTPPSLVLNQKTIDNIRDFVSSASIGRLRPALETRSGNSARLPQELQKIMQDNGMVHCVDLSKGDTPAYHSDILYTRMFGKGEHNIYQPTDSELAEIDNAVSSSGSERVVMSFHFVKMYKDAARMKTYKETGKFPMVTRSAGVASLEEVLGEDAVFPATRQELVANQGWKLFDQTPEQRLRLNEILEVLPEKTYGSVSEVINSITSIYR
jgi:uncharacterized protein YecE (DUF72 family)